MPGSCGELVAAGACGVRGTWTEVSSRGGSSSVGMLFSVRFWPVHSAILKVLVLSRAGPSAAGRCQHSDTPCAVAYTVGDRRQECRPDRLSRLMLRKPAEGSPGRWAVVGATGAAI